MAMKNCRECKTVISSDAVTCPSCGKRSPHGMSTGRKILWGSAAGILLIGAIGSSSSHRTSGAAASSSSSSSSSSDEASPAAPAVTVDAEKLWADYDANEVAADNTYKGKTLQVTGTIASIDKNFMNDMIIHLKAHDAFSTTMAELKSSEAGKAASLAKGARITVVCRGTGRTIGSPTLDRCVIAP